MATKQSIAHLGQNLNLLMSALAGFLQEQKQKKAYEQTMQGVTAPQVQGLQQVGQNVYGAVTGAPTQAPPMMPQPQVEDMKLQALANLMRSDPRNQFARQAVQDRMAMAPRQQAVNLGGGQSGVIGVDPFGMKEPTFTETTPRQTTTSPTDELAVARLLEQIRHNAALESQSKENLHFQRGKESEDLKRERRKELADLATQDAKLRQDLSNLQALLNSGAEEYDISGQMLPRDAVVKMKDSIQQNMKTLRDRMRQRQQEWGWQVLPKADWETKLDDPLGILR